MAKKRTHTASRRKISRAALGTKPPAELGRDAWVAAATDALGEHGVDGVRVEVLAKQRGLTKGSFYWHFKDRDDLLNTLLHAWKVGRIEDVRKQTSTDNARARAQIYRVAEVYSGTANRRGMAIELAIRDWARRDPRAAKVVAEVDEARLEYVRDLFLASGLPPREAASRSLLLYTYTFGLNLLNFDRTDIGPLKTWIADYIAK